MRTGQVLLRDGRGFVPPPVNAVGVGYLTRSDGDLPLIRVQ